MHTGRRVLAVRPTGSAVRLRSKFGWETFDVVVIATYLPDTAHLLDTSWLGHRLVDAEQLHCAAFTIDLDPAERVPANGPGFYCRDGLNVLVQPNHARAVVLCTRAPSTDPAYVVAPVRDSLGLTHPLGTVRTTANSRPGEPLFAAQTGACDTNPADAGARHPFRGLVPAELLPGGRRGERGPERGRRRAGHRSRPRTAGGHLLPGARPGPRVPGAVTPRPARAGGATMTPCRRARALTSMCGSQPSCRIWTAIGCWSSSVRWCPPSRCGATPPTGRWRPGC